MYPIYFMVLAIVFGIFQILVLKTPIFTAFTLAFILCNIGLQGIFAFLGHFFKSDDIAKGIGWPSGNPFQIEIAFTNLSLGILGILSIWFRDNFWLATIISRSVFTWGAAYVHLKDLKARKNVSIFNAGPILYFDILFPVFLVGLLLAGIINEQIILRY